MSTDPTEPATQTPWLGCWTHEADTEAFAQRLARCPALSHATLALYGDLGAGKTTLVRHLLRALGVRGRIKSPTYAVVEPHSAPHCPLLAPGATLSIWHFDFYRFSDPREWEDAGFRELFAAPGLKLVEWPERAGHFLPVVDLRIDIQTEDNADNMPAAANTPANSPCGTPADTGTTPDAQAEPSATRRVRATALTATGGRLLQHLRP